MRTRLLAIAAVVAATGCSRVSDFLVDSGSCIRPGEASGADLCVDLDGTANEDCEIAGCELPFYCEDARELDTCEERGFTDDCGRGFWVQPGVPCP